jgi:serine/threonine-protein kinase RsbW
MKTSLSIKNSHAELKKLKAHIQKLGRQYHMLPKVIHDLCLAVEEVVTNIIKYGYQDADEHEIKIDWCITEDEVCLTVTDDAQPFNPLEHPTPDLEKPVEDRNVGGLGIYLLRQLLMDDLEYQRTDGRNMLFMKKNLDPNLTSPDKR